MTQRVQLHPGTDAWMRGDRFGEIIDTKAVNTATPNHFKVVAKVKLDKSGKTRHFPLDELELI